MHCSVAYDCFGEIERQKFGLECCLWLLLHTYTEWWWCSRSLCTFGFFALPPFPRRRGGYEEASVRGQISTRRRINRGKVKGEQQKGEYEG